MDLDVIKIDGKLKGLVDERYKKGMAMAVPTSWTIRGVKVPNLKEIAKGLVGKKKTREDYLETIEFLDEAFERKDRELAIIGINVLYAYRKFFDRDLTGRIREWIGEVSDWEICDNISYLIIPELLSGGDFKDEDLLFLRDHENLFARRAYVVSRVKALRYGTGDADRILNEISFFVDDKNKYMVKALSWALRSAVEKSPGKVSKFLKDYKDRLSPTVVREVTNKLETGRKNK